MGRHGTNRLPAPHRLPPVGGEVGYYLRWILRLYLCGLSPPPLGGDGGGLGGLDALFHGIPYARVVEEYTKLYRKEDWTDGVPQAGERHQFVHRMARDLRYLCDMDKTMLVKMLHTSPT